MQFQCDSVQSNVIHCKPMDVGEFMWDPWSMRYARFKSRSRLLCSNLLESARDHVAIQQSRMCLQSPWLLSMHFGPQIWELKSWVLRGGCECGCLLRALGAFATALIYPMPLWSRRLAWEILCRVEESKGIDSTCLSFGARLENPLRDFEASLPFISRASFWGQNDGGSRISRIHIQVVSWIIMHLRRSTRIEGEAEDVG